MLSLILLASVLASADTSFSNRVTAAIGRLPGCLSRFLDYPPGAGVLGFPRCLWEKPFKDNPDFWLNGLDFSCVSPWNDSYGRFRAGTAISKRHVLFVNHFPVAVGTRMAFVGVNGDVSHYTIKATKSLPKNDILVGLLDYELTPDVHPAKVLPLGGESHFREGSKWPCVTFDQNERAYLSELTNTNIVWSKGPYLLNGRSSLSDWKKLGGNLISGDSGNPAFMIYNDQPILLYCVRGGGAGLGPAVHRFHNEIQSLMDDLCPGYKLDDFDLSVITDRH